MSVCVFTCLFPSESRAPASSAGMLMAEAEHSSPAVLGSPCEVLQPRAGGWRDGRVLRAEPAPLLPGQTRRPACLSPMNMERPSPGLMAPGFVSLRLSPAL